MSSATLAVALAMPAALRHQALWARLAVAAAGVLLAIALARLAWLLLAGPVLPLDAATPLPPPPAASSQGPAGSIAQWHLFGDAMPRGPQVVAAPETQLRLFLRGTLNTDVDGEGIAIIADADGGEQAYRAGDSLPGGATLTEVHAGRVLLSREGRIEQLSLPQDPAAGGQPVSAARAPAAGSGSGSAVPGPGMRPGALSFINPTISTAGPQLDAATRAALPDLAALASQVQVFPVLENGRFAGVRLAAGRDSDLLSRTGIRPTDIVTAVNGIPLDGPQRQQQLLDSLTRGGPVQVTVQRDGKPVQLSVSLR